GKVYSAKVTGKMVPVRIDAVNPHGGWEATNLVTKKRIFIKSAQRLRGLAATWPGKATTPEAKPAAKVATPAKKSAKAAKDATTTKKADTGERRGDGAKRPSGLDAAAKVLTEADGPLGCKEIVERALAKGYWKTNGKTPTATIYAAIIREIAAKGDASRFHKVERGKFTLATGKDK
ncbi:MAG: winged helix-turn-helix domain-containing protein, partial [Phycisphaerae bacterium]|nr:winged helix-turn-helix domain-containing protein [Phycisphaerae bacterium]